MLQSEDPGAPATIRLVDLRIAQEFVEGIRDATLDEENLSEDVLCRIRNPPCSPLDISDNNNLLFSLRTWMSHPASPEEIYNSTWRNLGAHPGGFEMPSLARLKSQVVELTGVIPLYHDMCVNSCIAYTGTFAHLERCPYASCGAERYLASSTNSSTRTPRRRFLTIPLGPQLQALYRSKESAEAMNYRARATEELFKELEANGGPLQGYHDYVDSREYIDVIQRGDLKPDDICLMLSVDGAQLYEHKHSDCWIYIWVILNLAPQTRYKKKHILIGGVFPGPNKPKNVDSFVFPGLHHVSALMQEGLPVWDAFRDALYCANLYVPIGAADGSGMAYLNGRVGHTGKAGCRIGCPLVGRHKKGNPIYFPVCLRPNNYDVPACDHADFDMESCLVPSTDETDPRDDALARYKRDLNLVLSSRTMKQYKERRLATGIAKPSIFLGLPENRRYPITGLFPGDIMHLVLNLADLLVNLWRGKIDCDKADDKKTWDWAVLVGDVWNEHGNAVARC